MNPRTARNDYRAFKVLLISQAGTGTLIRLTGAWSDAEQCLDYGRAEAPFYFAGRVEVVVIRTATREAVRTVTV